MIRFYTNAPEVVAQLAAMSSRVTKVPPSVYPKWEATLNGAVLPACPVDTGFMKSCIRAEFDRGGNVTGFWYGIKDSECDYAKYVEFAWGGRSAFFWDAFNSVKDQMARDAMEELENALLSR